MAKLSWWISEEAVFGCPEFGSFISSDEAHSYVPKGAIVDAIYHLKNEFASIVLFKDGKIERHRGDEQTEKIQIAVTYLENSLKNEVIDDCGD